MKRDMRTIEAQKLASLVEDNIRLRADAKRLWMKRWFPTALIVVVATAAFGGAYIAVVVTLIEAAK